MFNKTNSNAPSSDTPKKMSPTPRPPNSAPSILARDIIITGDIKTDGEVQIDGRLDGNIKAGKLTVGEQGIINGQIYANIVHIRGKVSGKIEAKSIELSDTANVQADLLQDDLTIANGAFFDGKCARRSAPAAGSQASLGKASAPKAAQRKST